MVWQENRSVFTVIENVQPLACIWPFPWASPSALCFLVTGKGYWEERSQHIGVRHTGFETLSCYRAAVWVWESDLYGIQFSHNKYGNNAYLIQLL